MKHCFDIGEYGACADGKTMNTKAIQQAIDACHESGGGTVLCGPGSFLTGALELKSNVELHLSAGCKIVGSQRLVDYAEFAAPGFIGTGDKAPEKSSQSLLRAVDAENIAITGAGEINGSGLAFYDLSKAQANVHLSKPPTPRPRIVMFYRCRQVRLEDAAFVDSPCWTIWLMQCRDVNVQRIKIHGDRRMCNMDGIDIDACRNVAVSDCFFETEDDCLVLRNIRSMYAGQEVCENVTVSNCVIDSHANGIRVGCPGDGVIRNCTFNNLVIRNSLHNGITFEYPKRYLPKDGKATADVSGIMFANVSINCAGWPIKIIVEDGIELAQLANLSFSNFRIKSGGPCLVQGSKETALRGVSFSNIAVETSGDDAVVCRHCEGIQFANVNLSNRA